MAQLVGSLSRFMKPWVFSSVLIALGIALLESQHLGCRDKKISLDCVEPLEKRKEKEKKPYGHNHLTKRKDSYFVKSSMANANIMVILTR